MAFTIEPKAIAAVHTALKGVPERRNTIPIVGMYHFQPGEGTVTVTASDLDLECSLTVKVETGDGFDAMPAACVPPYIVEAAGSVNRAEVKFAIDEQTVCARAGRSRFQAQILPGGDFPRLQQAFDGAADIEGNALAELIAAVAPAAPIKDETRYYLEGINLQVADGRLTVAATDGHRLHTTSIVAPDGFATNGFARDGIIVPNKAVGEIRRLASKAGDAPVTLQIGDRLIAAEAGDERIVSKLIDATYPDWRRVIPKACEITATFDLAEMIAALDRVLKVQAASDDNKERSGLKLAEDGDVMTIAAQGDRSEAADAVPAEFAGTWGARGVNGKYLRATLATMKDRGAEVAIIDAADAGSPMRIENPNDEDFLAVVMPMRIR